MIEIETKQCKTCGQIKQRILMGNFPNGRDKKWADEDGKLWNGSRCGACHKEKMKQDFLAKKSSSGQ